MKRNSFIKLGVGTILGSAALSSAAFARQSKDTLPIELVKEFVAAGHGDLDKVKSMLQDYPTAIYSSYDWGHGDYELAIEGAGHVGNKEIANYLIEQGARPNIFVLAMLGKMDIVQSLLTEFPSLLKSKGPHGFSLLHHAKVGSGETSELYAMIKDLGLSETKFSIK